MIDHSDFHKRFRRTQRLMLTWLCFVALTVLTIIGVGAYGLFSVATQPEIVGEFAGRIVDGIEDAR